MPIVGITLFIFGGVAELHKEPSSPRAEFLMAVVGPIASFLLGIGFMIASALFTQPPPVYGVLAYLGSLNWVLAIFNLVPAFPLDGGRMFRAGLWHIFGDFGRATRIASAAGQLFGVFLIVLGIIQFGLGNPVGGIWLFFIGLFLHGAAGTAGQQLATRHALAGVPVAALMQRNPIAVDADITVETLVENYFYRYFFHAFPVLREGRLVGCIAAKRIRDLPRNDWGRFKVADVMDTCSSEIIVPPGCSALDALGKMQAGRHKRLLVADRGDLRGVLTLSDMLQYLSLKEELGEPAALGEPLHGAASHA
jgi:CBS domain-containing protein